MNLRTLTALLVTATALSACDDVEIKRGMALLTGEVNTLHDREAEIRQDFANLQTKGTATEGELNALRQKYAELALKMESVGVMPEPLPEVAPPMAPVFVVPVVVASKPVIVPPVIEAPVIVLPVLPEPEPVEEPLPLPVIVQPVPVAPEPVSVPPVTEEPVPVTSVEPTPSPAEDPVVMPPVPSSE